MSGPASEATACQATPGRWSALAVGLAVSRPLGTALDIAVAGLTLLLIAAVASNRLGLRVGDFNVRIEFLAGGLVAVMATAIRRQGVLAGWGLVDVGLGGWFVVNLISSLAFSPSPVKSLKYVALLAGLLTIYYAARVLVRSERALVWAASAFVVLGAAVVLLGLVSALLFIASGPNFGILLERFYRDGVFIVVPKVQSVLWEPNIYGSFSLAVSALASALLLGRRAADDGLPPMSFLPPLAIATGMCGVMLSMTRTVWAVGPALILLMAAWAWRFGLAKPRQIAAAMLLPALLGGLAGLGVGLSLPALKWTMGSPWDLTSREVDDMVREQMFGTTTTPSPQPPTQPDAGQTSAATDRVAELFTPQVSSIAGRWAMSKQVLEGWSRRPLLGWGAGAFPLVYPPPPGTGYWIGNVMLHVLFDTGIVGLLLLTTAVSVAAWRALSTIRRPPALWTAGSYVTFGLLCAGLGLLAAFQITDGSWLGFTWVLLAMLVAAGGRGPKRDS